jgi:hypothetical protein
MERERKVKRERKDVKKSRKKGKERRESARGKKGDLLYGKQGHLMCTQYLGFYFRHKLNHCTLL